MPNNTNEFSRLAELWDLNPSPQELWSPQEFGAILKHQLSSPLQFSMPAVDAGGQNVEQTQQGKNTVDGPSSPPTVEELLNDPAPSLKLLVLLKEFAKESADDSGGVLPRDVAKVMYYLAIAAARVRCQKRITRLSDDNLLKSVAWAAKRPWISSEHRRLLNKLLTALEVNRAEPH